MLIDEKGYAYLSDFGLPRILNNRICKYGQKIQIGDMKNPKEIKNLALEVILNQDYSKYSDWWALGTIVYEMFVGYPYF